MSLPALARTRRRRGSRPRAGRPLEGRPPGAARPASAPAPCEGGRPTRPGRRRAGPRERPAGVSCDRSGIPAVRRSAPRERCAWDPPRTTAGGAPGSAARGGRPGRPSYRPGGPVPTRSSRMARAFREKSGARDPPRARPLDVRQGARRAVGFAARRREVARRPSGKRTVAVRKTGCSRVCPPRSRASARATVRALPSTTRSRSVRASTRSSRTSRTRPPTAATGSPSVSPWAPAARRISLPVPAAGRAPGRGTGAARRRAGLAEDDALGASGSSDQKKGLCGPRRCRTATSDACRGLDGDVPEDGRGAGPGGGQARARAGGSPACGGPRRAEAGRDEAGLPAVR